MPLKVMIICVFLFNNQMLRAQKVTTSTNQIEAVLMPISRAENSFTLFIKNNSDSVLHIYVSQFRTEDYQSNVNLTPYRNSGQTYYVLYVTDSDQINPTPLVSILSTINILPYTQKYFPVTFKGKTSANALNIEYFYSDEFCYNRKDKSKKIYWSPKLNKRTYIISLLDDKLN